MTGLRIAPDLELPLDAATGTFGVLATKGAGKSNAAVVLAERMYDAGIPWVAIDPKGDWHGIRSSADGKGPGLPIVVFGGRHGDVPLEPTAGVLIADLVLTQRLTCVLDVSQFTKADVTRFLLAFGRHLFAHADDDGAEPLHLFLEEAHEYLPQQVRGDQADLVNVWQRIVKQGRFKGLGCTLISQRSSVLNKDVLELIDTLIVLRTIGPRSRDSIKEWVRDQDVDPALLASLPGLGDGEAWVWSPGALRILQRVQFDRRRTFDSGATPKVGEKRRTPATVADVDLAAIKEQMAETIEKAKENDPREIRKQLAVAHKRIVELERDVEQARAEQPAPEVVEVPVLDAAALLTVEEVIKRWDRAYDDAASTVNDLRDALARVEGPTRDRPDLPRTRPASGRPAPVERQGPAQRPDPPDQRAARRPAVPRPAPAAGVAALRLGKGERIVLGAVAQHDGGVTREQLTVLTGYKSSARNAYIQRLSQAGYVTVADGRIFATDPGVDALGDHFTPLPTGDALREHWLTRLPAGEAVILRQLVDAYPDGVTRDELSEATGYKSSSRNAYIQRLRARELVTIRGGAIVAGDTLFDGGAR